VRVETEGGIVGWGEATCEGRSETVRTAVDQLGELLIGRDALRIEDHWQVMTKGSFYRGGPILASAGSGLDQALWDIAGKRYGAPVHQLLGARSETGSGPTAGSAATSRARSQTTSAPG
jgi:galactonate dehydratase